MDKERAQKTTRKTITLGGIEVKNVPVLHVNEFASDDYALSGRVMDNVLQLLLKNEQPENKKDTIDYMEFFGEQ